uniref:Uncharacterized protein n=1 Tax=Panagrolaimus sp. ES5 TaxID=591445 RepID=A0AC34GS27_9BILA
MKNIEKLEEQCEQIQDKLNSHDSTIRQVLQDLSECTAEDAGNESYFSKIKKQITNCIDEIAEEKGRLSDIKANASKLSSDLMSAERKLSDKVDQLEERSDYLWKKIRENNSEYEDAENERKEASRKLDEAARLLSEAVKEKEENDKRNKLIGMILMPIGGMALPHLLSLIDGKKEEIERLESNARYLQDKFRKIKEAHQKLESEKSDLERSRGYTRDDLYETRKNSATLERLTKKTVLMEDKIVTWTKMLLELNGKIQKIQKNRGMINERMFERQEDEIKKQIHQVVKDARITYQNQINGSLFDLILNFKYRDQILLNLK